MADTSRFEELCLQAADGNAAALGELKTVLAEMRAGELAGMDRAGAKSMADSFELVCDAVECVDDACHELFLQAAKAGFDSLFLRDRLADCARNAFSDYLDPAGMLFALGIHNHGAPATEIPVKWAVFEGLDEGVRCVHPLHGSGTVSEIDGLSNEVHIDGDRSQVYPLSVFLESFHLISKGTPVAGLLAGNADWTALADEGMEAVREAFRQSLVPATDGLDVIKAVLVPSVTSVKKLTALTGAAPVKKKKVEKPVETVTAESSPSIRPVSEARSLEELCLLIESENYGEFDDQAVENCRVLLYAGAVKQNAVKDFGRTLILMWNAMDGAEWLLELLRPLVDQAVIWTDFDQFGEFTNGLAAAKAEAWLKVTFATLPRDRAVQLVLRLPLKNLNMAQKVMVALGEDDAALLDGALERVRTGEVGADLIVWLWQRTKKKCEEIRDPILVMRTLGVDVRGPYLKANRDLKKMVIGNETFQKFLMSDGEPAMVKRMVSAIRQYNEVLESGERQSLLVRLARLYPEVREAIEIRTRSQRQTRSRKQSRITSYRSYVRRQKELQDILTVKIPENSRAIAHARSYGDLRENAEYKAAKEEQGHLSARRSEIERELNEVQPTDFSDVVNPEVVVPGTTVEVTDDAGVRSLYHLVGLWDGDPERDMLSYGTPLGQELLGKSVGDSVDLPDGRMVQVNSIAELPTELKSRLGDAES